MTHDVEPFSSTPWPFGYLILWSACLSLFVFCFGVLFIVWLLVLCQIYLLRISYPSRFKKNKCVLCHRVWKQNKAEEWVITYKEIEEDPGVRGGLDLSWVRAGCNPEQDVILCVSQVISLSPNKLEWRGEAGRSFWKFHQLAMLFPMLGLCMRCCPSVTSLGRPSSKLLSPPGYRGDSWQGRGHTKSTIRAQDPPCFWFPSFCPSFKCLLSCWGL